MPWGLRQLLKYIASRYPGYRIFVTENGCDAPGESEKPAAEALRDGFRVEYYRSFANAAYFASG